MANKLEKDERLQEKKKKKFRFLRFVIKKRL